MKKIIILAITLAIILNVNAQKENKIRFKHFSVDLYGGIPIVYGDIKNEFFGYNVTGRINWNMTSAFSLGGEFSYGNVIGQNEVNKKSYFINTYMKAMLGGEVYLFNVFKFHELSKWFQPFIGLNAGAVKSNIELSGNKNGTIGQHYNNWDFAYQPHIGLKFKITKWLDINARYSMVFIHTDHFDNYAPKSYSNNHNDMLTNVDLGFTFHIGAKGTQPIIWKLPNEQNNDLAKKTDQDSLAAKIDSMDAKLKATQEDLDKTTLALEDVVNQKNDLHQKVNELQEKMDNFSVEHSNAENSYNNNNTAPNTYYEDILKADLKGPLNAKYYVVSGSYVVQKHAERRVKQLQNLGYIPVIMKDYQAGLKRVVIDSSNDLNDIKQKVESYRTNLDPNAWIIQQK